MDTSAIAAIIRERAAANGVDPDLLLRIARAESGLNPSAGAKTSSAQGLFQFLNGTWKQYGRGDVLEPGANADAGARFTRDNIAKLQAAGHPVTPGNAYLSHFLGSGGASSALGADPAAPVSSVLEPRVIRANPFLAKMSIGDLHNWASRKVGGDAVVPAMASVSRETIPGAAPAAPLSMAPDGVAPDAMGGLGALAGLMQGAAAPQMQTPPPIKFNYAPAPGLAKAKLLAAMAGLPLGG